MKKTALLFVLLITFMACESDVEFNDPGFQAQKLSEKLPSGNHASYEYWKANEFSAKINNGAIIISGTDGFTTMEFRVAAYEFGTKYDLGVLASNRAKLTVMDDKGNLGEPIYETTDLQGGGYITFSTAENQEPGTISGTFNVTLVNKDNPLQTKTYNKGVFYRIPLEQAE